nr:hypothetical protein [uncultured Desulfobacter sp.]
MNNCPSDKKIALFLDGSLSDIESKKILTHAKECSECGFLLVDLISLESLETEDLLPELNSQEQESMSETIESLLSSEKKEGSSVQDRESEKTSKSIFSKLKDAVPSIAAGLGLGSLAKSVGMKGGAVPSLAEKNQNIGENSDRIDEDDDSNKNKGNENQGTDETAVKIENIENEFEYFNIESNQSALSGGSDMTDQTTPNFNFAPSQHGESPYNERSTEVYQFYNDTCAIRCQDLILDKYGIDVTQEELIQLASENGWYREGGGTPLDQVGNLLDACGISTNRYVNANVFNLVSELSQGHQIIVAVDGNELVNGGGIFEDFAESMGLSGANHAVIVAGINTADPDNVTVIVKDPGTGDVAKEYPIEQFAKAWEDSDNFMVATTEPPPQYENLPEMANFNYLSGHVSHIGQLPYEDFDAACDQTSALEPSFTGWGELSSSLFDSVSGSLPVVRLLDGISETITSHATSADEPDSLPEEISFEAQAVALENELHDHTDMTLSDAYMKDELEEAEEENEYDEFQGEDSLDEDTEDFDGDEISDFE